MESSTNIETFISYARKDGLVHAERLERELPNTWRDKRNLDPFKDFTAEIERAIDACKQVIVVITPDTMREDSFVRRELARAVRKKKPIIVVRFDDIDPPIIVETNTWSEWFKNGWDKTLDEIRRWITTFVPSFKSPQLVAALHNDPYRDYLGTLYDSIIDYLDQVIIKEVTLKANHTKDAVANEVRHSPLGNLYRRNSINEPEVRIETLREGLEHFKGRLLLLGEPGAGKTVSLLAAARDAVVRRLNDPKAPLPVWLRCTEWPSEHKTSLADWIKQQHHLTLTTFDDTFIFFDGFDELGTNRIRKIKDIDGKEREEGYDPRPLFLDIIPSTGKILLSCRIKEYEDFGTKVNLKGAVRLRPLEDSQIETYLSDLPDLWVSISSDPNLLDMMRTPLLLSLFAFGYRDAPEDVRALRDLNTAELSEVIFKRYVEERYNHEERRLQEMGQKSPFTLDEIYEELGRIAMRNASGAWRVKDNVLEVADFSLALKDFNRVQEFIEYVKLLHLLIPIENAVRFIHLTLRDHFVRKYCYPRVENPLYYQEQYYGTPTLALASLPNAEAFDVLEGLLSNPKTQINTHAVAALGRMRDIRAVEPLIKALKDKSINLSSNAAEALGVIGDARAVEPLITALKSRDVFLRQSAAEALGIIGDTRAVEPLITALMDEDDFVRQNAARSLGEIGDRRAVEPLIVALTDEDSVVRGDAAMALGVIGDVRAVEPLIAILKDKDMFVRQNVATALGIIGNAQAIEPLTMLLDDDNDDDIFNPSYAAQKALERIGTPEALKALEDWRKRQDNR